MRLLSLSKYLLIFIFVTIISIFAKAEEESVDLWKKEIKKQESLNVPTEEESKKKIKIKTEKKNQEIVSTDIKISNNTQTENSERAIYGIFDPQQNNFTLEMWSNTKGEDIKSVFNRVNKIKLSKSAEDIFINTIMTYSYLPENMSDEDFLNLKINWLIKNDKIDLLEDFLDKNNNFKGKKKIIQYLVDKNIAKADLKEGCKKVEFISKEIKDPYLEKFKIYCLIFNDKKNEAQLVFDLLKEQKLSDKFFDSKINFLLGIKKETDSKIKDDNLLNFYLSSITTPNFNYEPNKKTNKYIWEYLNAANLLKVEDLENKEKIKNLEIAANNNTFDKSKIFEIYKKIEFDLNSLINADGIYQSLDSIEARALIFQKFLLSDNTENKIKLLFLLKDLFKKDNLSNVFAEFMSKRLKEIDQEDIPESYMKAVQKNIISEEEYKLGKIKFDDKILHRSRVIRFYTEEGTPKQKSQKNLNSIYKKIKKNKNYFFSAKDLALIESLKTDGFSIPEGIKYKEVSKNYSIPKNLLNLTKNRESGLLALKFVEIIGEDEIYELDPETVYFIVHILNRANLIRFRNKVLTVALPLRS
tara:strand:+ start:218 stop:1969 length:1752 start_codon:yes stop_codon:yes gene_type:complete